MKRGFMGDRGNIQLTGGPEFPTPVYFYTHWRGSEMKDIVAKALAKGKGRWNDPSYLARIIFDELRGQDDGVTGFGISAVAQDNEHPILVVDMARQQVYDRPDTRKGFEHIKLRDDSLTTPVSFEEFVNP